MLKDLCNRMRNFRNIEFVKWHWNAPNEPLLIPIKKLWTLFWKINKNHLKTHKIFNGSKSFDQISGILQNMPRVVQRSHPYILIRMSQVRCWVTRPLIFWARSKWNLKFFCEYLSENLSYKAENIGEIKPYYPQYSHEISCF